MSSKKHLSNYWKVRITDLMESFDGQVPNISFVARQCHCSRTTVHRIWKKYLKTGSVDNKRRGRKSWKFTKADMMRLVNIVRKYRGLSLGGIKVKFDSVDKTISLSTIVKLLGRYGIKRWH